MISIVTTDDPPDTQGLWYWVAGRDRPDFVQLWSNASASPSYPPFDLPDTPFAAQTWSIRIDPAGYASVYMAPYATGPALRTMPLDHTKPWHVNFLLNDATSAGYPAGDNNFRLHHVQAIENPVWVPDPPVAAVGYPVLPNETCNYVSPDATFMLVTVWPYPPYLASRSLDVVGGHWDDPVQLLPRVSCHACLSPDGNWMVYSTGSGLALARKDGDVWTPIGPIGEVPWGTHPSMNGTQLYYSTVYGEIYVCDYTGSPPQFSPARKVTGLVGDGTWVQLPWISADGRLLLFTSDRPDGYGQQDIWAVQREGADEEWTLVSNLGPNINTPGDESTARLAEKAGWLFFYSSGQLMQAAIVTAGAGWVPTPKWCPGVDLIQGRHDPAVTADVCGRIWAIGGSSPPTQEAFDTVEVFDERTQTWRMDLIPPMPEQRGGAGAVTDSHGRVWVVGGGNYTTQFDTVLRYGTWEVMSCEMTTPRVKAGIAIGSDDTIYAFGGGSGLVGYLATAEKYDPAHAVDCWVPIASMQEARYAPGSARDLQGRIYAIGGQNTVVLKTVERYTPSTDTWEYVASLPEVLAATVAFCWKGEIWAVGGWQGWAYTNKTFIYNPGTNSWRAGPAMYEALGSGGVAIGLSGDAYVVGGQRWGGGPASKHVAHLVSPLLGDTDGDWDVDIFDVIDVVLAFGSVPGDPNWNPGADFNGNGIVDVFDVIDVVSAFGTFGTGC